MYANHIDCELRFSPNLDFGYLGLSNKAGTLKPVVSVSKIMYTTRPGHPTYMIVPNHDQILSLYSKTRISPSVWFCL